MKIRRILAPFIVALSVIGLTVGGTATVANAEMGSLVSATSTAPDQWEVVTTAPPVSIDVVGWGAAQDVCGTASTAPCTTAEQFAATGECVLIHLVWAVQTDTQNAADELYDACTAAATIPEPAVEAPYGDGYDPEPVVAPEPVAVVESAPAPVAVVESEPSVVCGP